MILEATQGLVAMRVRGPTPVQGQGRIRAQVLVLEDLVLTQGRALAAVRELTPGRVQVWVPARTQVPARVLGQGLVQVQVLEQVLEQVRAAALDRVRTTTNLTTRPKKKVSKVANQ